MGLYAIKIRDNKAASEIPAILEQHGYDVRFRSEDARAIVYTFPAKRRDLTFSISKDVPQRFKIGLGREGTAIVRILGDHDLFATSDQPRDRKA